MFDEWVVSAPRLGPPARFSIQGAFSSREWKRRLALSLLCLITIRLGLLIPVPGIDQEALRGLPVNKLQRYSICYLSISPYVNSVMFAGILMAILGKASLFWRVYASFSADERSTLFRLSRILFVPIAFMLAYSVTYQLEHTISPSTGRLMVSYPDEISRITATATLVAGTALVMWLLERISVMGVCNGLTALLFVYAVLHYQGVVYDVVKWAGSYAFNVGTAIILLGGVICSVVLIVVIELARITVPIYYVPIYYVRAAGGQGSSVFAGRLYLKIVTSDGIPPAIVSTILLMAKVTNGFCCEKNQRWEYLVATIMAHDSWPYVYAFVYVVLIIAVNYVIVKIHVNIDEVAGDIESRGGTIIPAYRAKLDTATYLRRVLFVLTILGGIAMSFVTVFPVLLVYSGRYAIFMEDLWLIISFVLTVMNTARSLSRESGYEHVVEAGRIVRR